METAEARATRKNPIFALKNSTRNWHVESQKREVKRNCICFCMKKKYMIALDKRTVGGYTKQICS